MPNNPKPKLSDEFKKELDLRKKRKTFPVILCGFLFFVVILIVLFFFLKIGQSSVSNLIDKKEFDLMPSPTVKTTPSSAPESTPESTPASTPEATPTPVAQTGGTYTVQDGETVGSIAQKFQISIDSLAQANNLKDPYFIVAGQKLTIPK